MSNTMHHFQLTGPRSMACVTVTEDFRHYRRLQRFHRQARFLPRAKAQCGTRRLQFDYCTASCGRLETYSHNYERARLRRSRKVNFC